MPIRVELTEDALDDLAGYIRSGNLRLFLKKLLRLEEVGKDAGLPSGRGLVGWRKIVVGDRNWRILFTTDPDESVATIWVIGDRDDAACYADARFRLETLGHGHPTAMSLTAATFELSEQSWPERRERRP